MIDAKCADSRFETDPQQSKDLKARLKTPLLGMCPEILRVCKQVREEALRFYYRNLTFVWDDRYPWETFGSLADTLDFENPRGGISLFSAHHIRQLRVNTFNLDYYRHYTPHIGTLPHLRSIDIVEPDMPRSEFFYDAYWRACDGNNEIPKSSADVARAPFMACLNRFRDEIHIDIPAIVAKESLQIVKLTGTDLYDFNAWGSFVEIVLTKRPARCTNLDQLLLSIDMIITYTAWPDEARVMDLLGISYRTRRELRARAAKQGVALRDKRFKVYRNGTCSYKKLKQWYDREAETLMLDKWERGKAGH